MSRCVWAIMVVAAIVIALVPACSESVKHRVLTFFLDGVPEPGKARRAETARDEADEPIATSLADATPAEPIRHYYTHEPYRGNDCVGCHNPDTGQLVMPLDEGLCLTCHGAFAAEERYLHGPVAVGACAFCHHHHASPVPGMLHAESTATCLSCHDRDDLTVGEHHSDLEGGACVECHNPHGGENRFFLTRSAP